ncbi:hypothetical protein HYH03_001103 [Edaphochlamys debaryana]|uniref:Uncharacterized protein n=1 Tax=Edaphochlamys debaryana TaxID=47281 RepID=A0A835YMP5_9CHLO|nr:hypothetical protein HYH03_001103 [Edaphochlamys debaryana]|eukprot:KAG2501305.1 hypothetical protein HYH03_001103 [Edaphochlamys debaryana]
MKKPEREASLLVSGSPDVAAEAIKEILAGAGSLPAATGGGAGGLAAATGSAPLAVDERLVGAVAAAVAEATTAQIQQLCIGLGEELRALLAMRSASYIEVASSACSAADLERIELAVKGQFNYEVGLHAPCCCDCCDCGAPATAAQPPFVWAGTREDADENVARAVPYLQKIVPPGLVVLPVHTYDWESATVHLGDTRVRVTGGPGYIFVPAAAWAWCRAEFGAELADGWRLTVQGRGTEEGAPDSLAPSIEDALDGLFPSIIGVYEAITTSRLAAAGGAEDAQGQALLEYLAINQRRGFPTNDVIVLYGDLNQHHVVHAGRKDAGEPRRSIHVASPPPAQPPAEAEPAGAAAAAEAGNREAVTMLGFIRALLSTPRTEEAGGSGVGAAGAGGSGACASGGGAASGRRGPAGDAGFIGADGVDGGSNTDGCSRSSGGAADRSDGGEEGFDGDEGLREAARENADAQTWLSVLRLPEVYEALGLTEPPTSFQPPTREALLARYQPYRG